MKVLHISSARGWRGGEQQIAKWTFVDTAEKVLATQNQVHFLIIGGDGGEQGPIEAYIREKGLTGHITLTGFRNDLSETLCELDVLLFPSKAEGLGTSLLDAMCCGVPIVATRAGGIPEVVEHGVSGLLGPIQDSTVLAAQVNRLLGDSALRDSLIAAGRARADAFSTEATARKTLRWYEECLST